MRRLALLLALAIAAPASAGRPRPTIVLLPAPPCVGEYVLLAKWGPVEDELARAQCSELPKCVEYTALYSDHLIFGRFEYVLDGQSVGIVDLPAVRDESTECPE